MTPKAPPNSVVARRPECRGKLIDMIFKLCTAHGKPSSRPGEPNRMGTDEMEKFAIAYKFPSDALAWAQDFWKICEGYGMPFEDGLTKEQFTAIVDGGITRNMRLGKESQCRPPLTLNELQDVADVINDRPSLKWPNSGRIDDAIQDNRAAAKLAVEASIQYEEARDNVTKIRSVASGPEDPMLKAAVTKMVEALKNAGETAWHEGWPNLLATPNSAAEAKIKHDEWTKRIADCTENERGDPTIPEDQRVYTVYEDPLRKSGTLCEKYVEGCCRKGPECHYSL